ncbi:hypothetical protein KKF84_10930, partial [Myxococcota bacterium]|nr:hypothetical protein [Myxococcota bacterium]MBU1535825.1 hypothetical protein [Myxococcota bacterium]
DGNNFNGESCVAMGYNGGALVCNSSCLIDISHCQASGQCGNGAVDLGYEDCDGIDLNGQDCLTLGFQGGTLSCSPSCTFDYSACTGSTYCGDGIVQAFYGEMCDGDNLNALSCSDLGYSSGTLSCLADCSDVDTSLCFSITLASIAAGFEHSCAVDTDGNGWCWGFNGNGTIGDGTLETFAPGPSAVVGGHAFSRIVAGGNHSCALDPAGQSWCWGFNGSGQTGYASNVTTYTPSSTPLPSGHYYTALSVGVDHSCALDETGAAWCWGANDSGQLGHADTVNVWTRNYQPQFVIMPVGRTFVQLDCGENHSCAVDNLGNAWCWGKNNGYQLGTGDTADMNSPSAVLPSGAHFVETSCGSNHSCGLDETGQVWCWGRNDYGQLGIGNMGVAFSGSPLPVVLPVGRSFTSVTSGWLFTCALDDLGEAWCWGNNMFSSLGNGTQDYSSIPTPVSMPAGKEFVQISTSNRHVCAVDSTGGGWCWGQGISGQLGDSSMSDKSVPTLVSGTSN